VYSVATNTLPLKSRTNDEGSTARVMFPVDPPETFPGHVGIYLGSRQVTVPQQHLHHAQIGAMIHQVRCECVTQGMRGQMPANSATQRVLTQPVPERLARDA